MQCSDTPIAFGGRRDRPHIPGSYCARLGGRRYRSWARSYRLVLRPKMAGLGRYCWQKSAEGGLAQQSNHSEQVFESKLRVGV